METNEESLRVDVNSISIFQKEKKNMHGIFSLLQTLNLETRYSITSRKPANKGFVVTNLDKYYKQHLCYQSSSEDPSFIVTFDSPFLLSGYSISNHISGGGNSFPRDWSLFGSNSQNLETLKLIDQKKDQLFCENAAVCETMHINTYSTMNVYKNYKPYRTFFFNQTRNSCDEPYLLMRAIDFYGVLCPQTGPCGFPLITLNSNGRLLITRSSFVTYLLLK